MLVVVALLAGYYAFRSLGPDRAQSTYELNGDLLVHGNPTLKEVALTFDDGPYGETTEEILSILAEEGVQATFFVVGRHVEQRPELVRKIMASGHEVGNHTYSHPRLTEITSEQAREELVKCEQAVFDATGAHMNLMRPPGMKFDDGLLRLNQELGYTTIHWNAVAGDYVPVEPETIVKRILWQAQPGSVILLHDTPFTAAALRLLVQRLKQDGYRFVTVTQMLARLPRPVFLVSNAGTVSVEEPEPVAVRPASNGKRRREPGSINLNSGPRTPLTDVPTWDGPIKEQDELETA
jgi:peptidoglycan/xylan/chitin deacetylase (PgdA/CDA1 family)